MKLYECIIEGPRIKFVNQLRVDTDAADSVAALCFAFNLTAGPKVCVERCIWAGARISFLQPLAAATGIELP